MLIVIMLLVGSMILGMFWKELDVKAGAILVLMVAAAVIGFYFFRRFL